MMVAFRSHKEMGIYLVCRHHHSTTRIMVTCKSHKEMGMCLVCRHRLKVENTNIDPIHGIAALHSYYAHHLLTGWLDLSASL